jgi:cytochrome P450
MSVETAQAIGSPAYFNDPYPFLMQLRTASPVHYLPEFDGWLVTRHDIVQQVLNSADFRADRVDDYQRDSQRVRGTRLLDGSAALMRDWFIFMDGVQHRDRKTRLAQLFHAQLANNTHYIQSTAENFVANWRASGGGDIMKAVARPLASDVICQILGIAPKYRAALLAASQPLAMLVGRKPMSFGEEISAEAKVLYLIKMMREVIDQKVLSPDGSLLGQCVVCSDFVDTPDRREVLISDAILLLFGGQDTSANAIGNALHALSARPTLWPQLRSPDTILANVVEELLRYDPPVQSIARRVARPVVLAGVELAQNARVILSLAAANRDPDVYAFPDEIDFGRPKQRHLGFGGGMHLCVGAALARLELSAVLAALSSLPVPPTVRAAPAYPHSMTLRGPLSLEMSAPFQKGRPDAY